MGMKTLEEQGLKTVEDYERFMTDNLREAMIQSGEIDPYHSNPAGTFGPKIKSLIKSMAHLAYSHNVMITKFDYRTPEAPHEVTTEEITYNVVEVDNMRHVHFRDGLTLEEAAKLVEALRIVHPDKSWKFTRSNEYEVKRGVTYGVFIQGRKRIPLVTRITFDEAKAEMEGLKALYPEETLEVMCIIDPSVV